VCVCVSECAYVYMYMASVHESTHRVHDPRTHTHAHLYVYIHTAISETKYVIKHHTDIASHTAPHQNPMYARERAHTGSHLLPTPPHCRYRCIPVAGAAETLSCKSAADGFAEDASASRHPVP
jgi:hypothetical protein